MGCLTHEARVLIFGDTETRSRVPIQHGNDNYTRNAECMLFSWVPEKGDVRLWECFYEPIPEELDGLLDDPKVIWVFHNAQFDRAIIRRALKRELPIQRVRCTMAQAYSHGLPGSLGTLGQVLGLPEDQQKNIKDGKLIQLFCIPRADGSWATRETHPEQWSRFLGYAKQDPVALREIHRRLPVVNYQGDNLASWWLDQLINERGFGFDAELARAARALLDKAKARTDCDLTIETAGSVTAATQRAKLFKYLNDSGLALPNMQAATMRAWLEQDDLRPEHKFLLETRLEAAKSSGSKYRTGLDRAGADGRIRWAIQFNGAGRTGRDAGRGFQPHNLARPNEKAQYIEEVIIPGILSGAALDNPLVYGGPQSACASALRGAIIASPGNELVVADWSNVESRILAWLADETWKLEAYRAVDQGRGTDLYKLLFAQFFGVQAAEVTEDERQAGKVAELAFGFGGGVGALVTMAAGYGMSLTELVSLVLPSASDARKKKAYKAWRRAFLEGEDYGLEPKTYQACDVLKQAYREANAKINGIRHEIGDAVMTALKDPGSLHEVAKCRIWFPGTFLVIELPSGRRLLYANPKIETTKHVDVETGKETIREHMTYSTARGKSWIREKAWSGLFVENIVQAVANDVLRAARLLVHRNAALDCKLTGILTPIVLHVHDEIVVEVPQGKYALSRLIALMTANLIESTLWLRGLPLAAKGYVGTRYRKE